MNNKLLYLYYNEIQDNMDWISCPFVTISFFFFLSYYEPVFSLAFQQPNKALVSISQSCATQCATWPDSSPLKRHMNLQFDIIYNQTKHIVTYEKLLTNLVYRVFQYLNPPSTAKLGNSTYENYIFSEPYINSRLPCKFSEL